MNNKDILKKRILYNSNHRGTKEMDLLLGNFVNKHINFFGEKELSELESLLKIDDEILYKWYFNQQESAQISKNSISKKLRKFKL